MCDLFHTQGRWGDMRHKGVQQWSTLFAAVWYKPLGRTMPTNSLIQCSWHSSTEHRLLAHFPNGPLFFLSFLLLTKPHRASLWGKMASNENSYKTLPVSPLYTGSVFMYCGMLLLKMLSMISRGLTQDDPTAVSQPKSGLTQDDPIAVSQSSPDWQRMTQQQWVN